MMMYLATILQSFTEVGFSVIIGTYFSVNLYGKCFTKVLERTIHLIEKARKIWLDSNLSSRLCKLHV